MNSNHLSKYRKDEKVALKPHEKTIHTHRTTIKSKEIANIAKLLERQSKARISYIPKP